jgi:D-alanyl-D-alanine carboxypeptidase/D-alanyl-D-alanine-endopeptidase (penicillin-binding protein 4)
MTRRLWIATVTIALLAAVPVPADKPDLPARIGAIIDAPEYKHSRWGLLVTEADSDRVVFERNCDQLFAPASTTKLYSCSSALHYLGADYRFETPVFRRGSIDDGRLHGDLILVASGDLTMGGRTLPDGTLAFTDNDHTYADNTTTTESLTPTNPLAGLVALARQVRGWGIRSIDGEVLVDPRLFDTSAASGSGPKIVSPIVINDNIIDVIVTPAMKADQAAVVTIRPETALIVVDAQVQTTTEGLTSVDVSGAGPGRLVVRGKLPITAKPQLRTHAVEDPVAFARASFIETLRREGVAVSASPLREPRAKLPAREAYGQLTRVAMFTSPPLSEAIKVTLKVSHNLYASTLPLLVAAKHGERTLTAGLRRQRDYLRELSVDTDAVSFGGGAGGAAADATTPRATVSLLHAMAKYPEYPAMLAGLPILGVDGTLATVVGPNSPAHGKVRAKTGTLWYDDTLNGRAFLRSKALAGTMTTARGTNLIFAMFVNDVPLPAGVTPAREGKMLGKLCEVLYENGG